MRESVYLTVGLLNLGNAEPILLLRLFCLYECLCTICVPGACRVRKVSDTLELKSWMDGYKPPYGSLESNLDPLQEQKVFLTAKPFLQLLFLLFSDVIKESRM